MTLVFQVTAAGAENGPTFVVNSATKVEQQTRDSIKQLFKGEKSHFDSGEKVRLAMIDDKFECVEYFLKNYLSLTVSEFNQLWRMQLFSGRGVPPKRFDTESALLDYMKQTTGAIGFVCGSSLPAGVQKIQVN